MRWGLSAKGSSCCPATTHTTGSNSFLLAAKTTRRTRGAYGHGKERRLGLNCPGKTGSKYSGAKNAVDEGCVNLTARRKGPWESLVRLPRGWDKWSRTLPWSSNDWPVATAGRWKPRNPKQWQNAHRNSSRQQLSLSSERCFGWQTLDDDTLVNSKTAAVRCERWWPGQRCFKKTEQGLWR